MLDAVRPAPNALEPVLPTTQQGRRIVLAIILVALVLRVGVVVVTRGDYRALTDSLDYDRIATSLSNGSGYPEAVLPPTEGESGLRAPMYPVSLAMVYVVAGDHSWTAGRLANALIGTALVAMIGVVAAMLWSRRTAAVAMAMAAVYPPLILAGSALLLEPLLVTLSLATLAAVLQHRREPHGLLWPIVAGVFLAMSMLTREISILLIPAMVLLLWTIRPRWSRRALAAPAAFLLTGAVVFAPWVVRNAVELDAFVPTTTSAGYGLAGTYNETVMNDDTHPARWVEPYNDPYMLEVVEDIPEPVTEVELDRELRGAVIDVVKDHPEYVLKATVFGTQRLFDWDGGDYTYSINAKFLSYPLWLAHLAVWSGWVVFALAVVGAFLPGARRVPFAVWLTPILFYVFVVVTLPASIRYRVSMEPYFVFLASIALLAGFDRYQRRQPDQRSSAADLTPRV